MEIQEGDTKLTAFSFEDEIDELSTKRTMYTSENFKKKVASQSKKLKELKKTLEKTEKMSKEKQEQIPFLEEEIKKIKLII